jgi:hypothetical protein
LGVVREFLTVVTRVQVDGQPPLLLVADAKGLLRLRLGFRQRRQEHAGEDRDDGNHHEQFNQGEAGLGGGVRPQTGGSA